MDRRQRTPLSGAAHYEQSFRLSCDREPPIADEFGLLPINAHITAHPTADVRRTLADSPALTNRFFSSQTHHCDKPSSSIGAARMRPGGRAMMLIVRSGARLFAYSREGHSF